MLDLNDILKDIDISRVVQENLHQPQPSSRQWEEGRAKDITFIVTKDCQLACRY